MELSNLAAPISQPYILPPSAYQAVVLQRVWHYGNHEQMLTQRYYSNGNMKGIVYDTAMHAQKCDVHILNLIH